MKKIIGTALILVLLLAAAVPAAAEHLSGAESWLVTFTAEGKLESNFSTSGYSDAVRQLQPGDDVTLTVSLTNKHAESTDWYMSNQVLTSLEDSSSAVNGAYEYLLTYDGPGGSRILYSSETVGGDNSQGLHEATNALQNFFYLDTLGSGQQGTVTLVVTLDGETQGNSYGQTLADLRMNFAVEYETDGGSNVPTVVKTGDPARLFPYFIAMAASGVALLVLAFLSLRRRRKERKEGAK